MAQRTVVVGLQGEYVNNLSQIPPELYAHGVRVLVHHNPTVRLTGSRVRANMDIMVDFTVGVFSLDVHYAALDDSYHHIHRFTKSEQMLVMSVAKTKVSNDSPLKHLELPATLTMQDSPRAGSYHLTPLDVKGASFGRNSRYVDRVVLRPENGAKGCGQALVPLDQLKILMVDISNKVPLKDLKEKYSDVVFTDPDRPGEDNVQLSASTDYSISEYVSDIVEEYRIIVGGRKVYITTRSRSAGPYPQANLDGKVKTRDYIDLNEDSPLYDIVKEIRTVFNLRLGSIDLYKNEKGEFGFLECCPQFGTWAIPHEIAYDVHESFIHSLVEEYLTTDPIA